MAVPSRSVGVGCASVHFLQHIRRILLDCRQDSESWRLLVIWVRGGHNVS